jgi:hypothetical protein
VRESTNLTLEMAVPPEADASGHCGGHKNTSTQQVIIFFPEYFN